MKELKRREAEERWKKYEGDNGWWSGSFFFFFLVLRRRPKSTHCISLAASDGYKRQPLRALLAVRPCLHYEF